MADEVDSKYEAFVADVRPTFGGAAQQQRKDWAMSELPVSQATIDGLSALVDHQEAIIADLRSQLETLRRLRQDMLRRRPDKYEGS